MLTCDSLLLLWPKGLNLLKPQRFRPIIFYVKYSFFFWGTCFFWEKYFDNWTNLKFNFLQKLKIYFYWIFNDKIYSKVRFGRPQNDKTNKQHSIIPLYLGRFGTNSIYVELLKISKIILLKRKTIFCEKKWKIFWTIQRIFFLKWNFKFN
jgi:hypothetical protein